MTLLSRRFLVSAAGDRFISLWDATEKGSDKSAIMVFTTDSVPSCLRFSPSTSDKIVSFLAVAQSGSLGVWRVPAPSGKRKSKEGGAPIPAQVCVHVFLNSQCVVCLAVCLDLFGMPSVPSCPTNFLYAWCEFMFL